MTLIPEKCHPLYGLLPIAGRIDFFRWSVMGTPVHPTMWAIGLVSTLFTFAIGLAYFKRVEDNSADVV